MASSADISVKNEGAAGRAEPVGREELLARARSIAPGLKERAAEAEALARVPDATIADYRAAGLIRMTQPRRFSGFEMSWDVLCEVSEILAAADGSQAWIQRICADHAQMVSTFPPKAQDDVWGDDHNTLVSAAFDPVGRAKRVDGGFVFSGRHGFSSGIDHAGWMICGGFIDDDGELDGPHFFLVPKTDATVLDDWDTMSLRGTGSKSFVVEEAFIPEHRFLDGARARAGEGPGTAVNTAPVYRSPRGGITSTGFAALTVGMARGLLAEWLAYTRPRKSRGEPVAEREAVQLLAAEASATIDAAGALYMNSIRSATAVLEAGGRLDQMFLATTRRNVAFACQLSLRAGTRLFNAAGGRVLFAGNAIERQYRNLLGAAAHHGTVWETNAVAYGKRLLTDEPA